MPLSKEAQVAEAKTRTDAGIEPGENLAVQGTDDGSRGDPGNDGTRQQRQAEPEPQRPLPPARSAADIKRDDILKRFRTGRGEQEAEARDEISDFQRSGMPPEFETPAELRTEPEPGAVEGDQALEPEVSEVVGHELAPAPIYRVKVHGVEKEISLDDLIANAQKALAAENILDEAKSKAREIDSLLSETKSKVARADRSDPNQVRQPSTQPAEQGDPAEGTGENQVDPIVKLIETMQFGDPNEVAPHLRETIQGLVNVGVKEARALERLQDEGAKAARALNKAKIDHPEIAGDPMASAAVEAAILHQQVEDIKSLGVELNLLRPDGLDPTPGDIATAHRWYRSNGFQVSSPETMLEKGIDKFLKWKGQVTPPAADTPAPAPDNKAAPRIEVSVERQARRAAVPQQPKPSGTPRAVPAAPPQARSRSDIVNSMIGDRNKPRGRVGITN